MKMTEREKLIKLIETGITIVCRERDKRGIEKPAIYVVM